MTLPTHSLAEQVFRKYAPHAYHLAFRMLNDEYEAESVAAEVLLRVVEQPSLTSLLDHLTRDVARRRRAGNRSHEPARSGDLARRIKEAVASLPPVERQVYVLAELQGLPGAVVGEELGLGLPELSRRLHKARLWMRQALA